jgi:hypothetical protein
MPWCHRNEYGFDKSAFVAGWNKFQAIASGMSKVSRSLMEIVLTREISWTATN